MKIPQEKRQGKYRLLHAMSLSALLLLGGACLSAPARAADFSFGMIGQAFARDSGEAVLRNALAESDAENLAFVVVNGIKSAVEPCSDQLYAQRRSMLESVQNGVIMSLAANDWVTCKNKSGKSAAIERLNQIRELFYDSDLSFGASKLNLIRQSASPKFREYAENARWEMDGILFATINLPANNNHYRNDGGRNGEFEDRLIANRDWLQRLFTTAVSRKLTGIVLFSDANPLMPLMQRAPELRGQRDGFNEVRQQLNALSAKYAGRVLLMHAQQTSAGHKIVWQRNLGTLASDPDWSKIDVDMSRPELFYIAEHKERVQMTRR